MFVRICMIQRIYSQLTLSFCKVLLKHKSFLALLCRPSNTCWSTSSTFSSIWLSLERRHARFVSSVCRYWAQSRLVFQRSRSLAKHWKGNPLCAWCSHCWIGVFKYHSNQGCTSCVFCYMENKILDWTPRNCKGMISQSQWPRTQSTWHLTPPKFYCCEWGRPLSWKVAKLTILTTNSCFSWIDIQLQNW